MLRPGGQETQTYSPSEARFKTTTVCWSWLAGCRPPAPIRFGC